MFENSAWKQRQTAATGQGIVSKFAFRYEILREKEKSTSRQKSVLDFFQVTSSTRASPPALLDSGGDDPVDRPAAQDRMPPCLNCHSFVISYFVCKCFIITTIICLCHNMLPGTTLPTLTLRLWENLSRLTSPDSEPPAT